MDKYSQDSELQCNVTTSPSDRPVLSRRLSRRPKIKEKPKNKAVVFQSSNNEKTFYHMGERLVDLSLSGKYFHEDDKKFLDELEERNSEAYVYSSVPGSLFQHCPLTRGVKGDPSDGTYVGTVSTGTVVYLPHVDTSSQVYLEETDFENNPVLADGIIYKSSLNDHISKDLPLGRGVAILSKSTNYIKNSLFAHDSSSVYNWALSSGTPMPRINADGWMGVPALELWGTEVWSSSAVDISSLSDGDNFAVSFGWRTDGTMDIRLTFFNGGSSISKAITKLKGSGYCNYKATVPPGYGGAGADVKMLVSLTTGIRGSFCAPQIVLDISGLTGRKEYPVFIGASGNNKIGSITAQTLKYTGNWQAGVYRIGGTADAMIIVSGYIQPMLSVTSNINEAKYVYTLVDSYSGKYSSVYLYYSGALLTAYLYSDGVLYSGTTITSYNPGDTIFMALYVGWTSGTYTLGFKTRVVGGDTTYSAEDNTSADKFVIYDTLYVGSAKDGTMGADSIFQDVNVWSGTEAMVAAQVKYMADPANLMEHREVLGRKYRISANLSPNPYNRRRYDGTISCENTKVL